MLLSRQESACLGFGLNFFPADLQVLLSWLSLTIQGWAGHLPALGGAAGRTELPQSCDRCLECWQWRVRAHEQSTAPPWQEGRHSPGLQETKCIKTTKENTKYFGIHMEMAAYATR